MNRFKTLVMMAGFGSMMMLGFTAAQADAIIEDSAEASYARHLAQTTNFKGEARDEIQLGAEGVGGGESAGDAGAGSAGATGATGATGGDGGNGGACSK